MAKETLYAPALWRKLEARAIPEPNSGCLLWLLGTLPHGYGVAYKPFKPGDKKRPYLAHRLAWEAHYGPVPDGLEVCHKCDVRACINPRHLFLGTHLENVRDMHTKGREARGSTHGMAKLTDAEVYAIRASMLPWQILADRYGVSRSRIYAIRAGDSWSHL